MRFNTQYDRVRQPAETNSGITLVERAGYISAQQRIENLMLAGQRLVQARKELYDFPDGKIDPDFEDPTRRKNYDLADGFQDGLKVEAKLKAQREAVKASQTAQEAPEGTSEKEKGGE